jgi:hypothetical protein
MSDTSNKANPAPRLYAHIVLDRSGSMVSCADDAVGGYNTYVASLPEAARVSLTLFDSGGVDLVRDAVAPEVAGLRPGEFEPRASTPLYDAIGRTVLEAEKRSAGFDRVALVILTDGYENASREFDRNRIRDLLKRKQEKDNWLVIYLGANQDAWAVGQQFGTDLANSLSFDADRVQVALASVGRATKSFLDSPDARTGRSRSRFSDIERDLSRKSGR